MCSLSFYAHFVLVNEPRRMTSGLRELSNLLRDCTQQDVSQSLCWAVSCQHVHAFVDSLISISIDWFQSPTLHLRSTSCFFTVLFELRGGGLSFISVYLRIIHFLFTAFSRHSRMIQVLQTGIAFAFECCFFLLF